MPTNSTPAPGSRPEGARSEADASQQVRAMFTQIAPRYDFLNHLLSLQLDRLWRARTAKILRPILQRPDAIVLDLCCGTGDLALALAREGPSRILGADFSHTMLVRARAKASETSTGPSGNAKSGVILSEAKNPSEGHESGYPSSYDLAGQRLLFAEADALRLPFADQSFDLVTTAFGFRNLANYEAGLREILRVLKPGGTIAILEFTEPPNNLLGNLYRWYVCSVLPRIGALISGHSSAYTYLPKSVSRFFRPPELAALMSSVGFLSVNIHTWTLATVALHTAARPL
jgi:demethylmenaquinone methyltransferase / 2-methoxy-6-polyprenyl-1,4-benzoquinol methylase